MDKNTWAFGCGLLILVVVIGIAGGLSTKEGYTAPQKTKRPYKPYTGPDQSHEAPDLLRKKHSVPKVLKSEVSDMSGSYTRGSPEWTLSKYLEAWQQQDWKEMVRYTQKTWKKRANPSQMLANWYDFKKLTDVTIGVPQRKSSCCVDIPFTIQYSFGGEIRRKRILARLIRESGPYQPSTTGEWGVNPLSTLN